MEEFTAYPSHGLQCQASTIHCSTTMETRCSKLSSIFPSRNAAVAGESVKPGVSAAKNAVGRRAKSRKPKSAKPVKRKRKIVKKTAKKEANRGQKTPKVDRKQGTLDTFFKAAKVTNCKEVQKSNSAPKAAQNLVSLNEMLEVCQGPRGPRQEHLSPQKPTAEGADVDRPRTAFETPRAKRTADPNRHQPPPIASHPDLAFTRLDLPPKPPISPPKHPSPFVFTSVPVSEQRVRNLQLETEKRLLMDDISDLIADIADRYRIIKPVGKGSFAVVYFAIHVATGDQVAVKVYRNRTVKAERQTEIIDNEITILSRLKGERVAQFREVVTTPVYTLVVLELINGLTLSYCLHKTSGKRMPEPQALRLFKQVVDCVHSCHSKSIYHRDIKLSNVMVKKSMEVVLIDFGFAITAERNSLVSSYCGTLNYLSPELLRNAPYRPGPVDVWALGILLFKLLTGEYPFNSEITRRA